MSLLEKLKKNSTVKQSAILSESKFFSDVDVAPTKIPALNIAISGSLTGGLRRGVTIIAGESKNFKSLFSLIFAEAYLSKHKDAVVLFYDSEYGSPSSYFESVGISTDRVLHTPITDIEELKFDIMQQLENIEKGDKVVIIVDSIGNLASAKETADALDGKSVADMSRAKSFKSLFRMVTPKLTTKDIPLIAVGHVYKTMELYSKNVLSGGVGAYYAADTILFVGRSQEKDGTELMGYNFNINIEKSRHVREKSKIPITVKFEGGVSKYSGLIDIALESGHVKKPANGWYSKVDMSTGEIEAKKYRLSDTDCKEFWESILADKSFAEWVEKTYMVSFGKLLQDESENENDE